MKQIFYSAIQKANSFIALSSLLLFAAADRRNYGGGSLNLVGSGGYYWSASANSAGYSLCLNFTSSNWRCVSNYRAYGYAVRAVAEE